MSKRQRTSTDLRRLEPRTALEQEEHERRKAEILEDQRQRKNDKLEYERGRLEQERQRAIAAANANRTDRRRLAWQHDRASKPHWSDELEARLRSALATAAPLLISASEYHDAVACVNELLVSGATVDLHGRRSRLEYFILRREFARQGGCAGYHGSRHWKDVRRRQLQELPRCEWCGSTREADRPLDVHHLHYATVGAERSGIDLVTLCRWCHDEVHGREWSDRSDVDVPF